jgi:high affinity Mn2+ porin
LLGDGALRYGHEIVTEAYYTATVRRGVYLSPDLIWLVHPGYNRDRGPALVWSARFSVRY